MYDKFIVYTDHAALNLLLQIEDTSGRLIQQLLSLAEFDLEVAYKKGRANTQVDAISRLNSMNETIPNEENDDISVFDLEVVNVQLELNKPNDGADFIDVQYAIIDDEYAEMDGPPPPHSTFKPTV